MPPQARVLVVEDEEGLRHSIEAILKHHGFSVVLAPNVPEALQVIDAEHFDVLLSDLRMPGPGDGLTVIRAMHKKNKRTVTLLMSATLEASEVYAHLQADEILPKPVRMQEVIHLIQQKLGVVVEQLAAEA